MPNQFFYVIIIFQKDKNQIKKNIFYNSKAEIFFFRNAFKKGECMQFFILEYFFLTPHVIIQFYVN